MARIPAFSPAGIRLWNLVQARHGRLRRVRRLAARDSPDPFRPSCHMHAVPHLLLCLAGAARVRLGRGGAIDLVPGEALAMAPGAWHHHEPLAAGGVLYIQGLLPTASDVTIWEGGRPHPSLVPLEPSRLLLQRLNELPPDGDAMAVCDELIEQFLREEARPWELPSGPLGAMTLHYWHNLHRPITAADLVAVSGLGGTRANRLFRDYHGQSPKQALLASRIALARQLLREGMAVGEAAPRCGFATVNSFTRAFRRACGVPPRAWRACAG